MIKISIIGNGKHSKRIQKILIKKKLKFIIYKPNNEKYYDEKKFEEVKKCNVIFIISPNNTHYYYINKLKEKRYIFCEKPPVSNLRQLKNLSKFSCNKIYFNFNKRFSTIAEILDNIKKYNLGELVYANIISSHGLALKNEYKYSWRSAFNKCRKGVFEIVTIHDLDLINYFYAIKKVYKPTLINLSKVGTSFDTSFIRLQLKNNAMVDIFSTYSSSFLDEWTILFKNGIIKKTNDGLVIRKPTKTFDKKGLFVLPKIKYKINISSKKDYKESLLKSVSLFLKCAKNKKKLSKHLFKTSINSNFLLLN